MHTADVKFLSSVYYHRRLRSPVRNLSQNLSSIHVKLQRRECICSIESLVDRSHAARSRSLNLTEFQRLSELDTQSAPYLKSRNEASNAYIEHGLPNKIKIKARGTRIYPMYHTYFERTLPHPKRNSRRAKRKIQKYNNFILKPLYRYIQLRRKVGRFSNSIQCKNNMNSIAFGSI